MIPVEKMRTNELVTQEQWRKVDERVHWNARNFLTARRILNLSPPMGFGVESVAFDEFTEVSDADFNFSWPEQAGVDAAVRTRTTVPVPIIRKDIYVGRRKLEASRRWGTAIDTASIDSATYKVTDKEDALLFQGVDFDGDGTTEIDGLYTGAGNDYSTTKDWGTVADLVTSLIGGIALLVVDNIPPPYNISVNGAQWTEASAIRAYTDVSYQTVIRNILGGELYLASKITAGTGLMSASPFAGWFDGALTQDLMVERAETLAKNLQVRIFEAMVPRIYDDNALCKLSAI